jgi:bifunctional NMN adenylyltransferase/nudix hydrolase
VEDWRYRHEVDKIVTTLFVAEYLYGAIQPDDDIEELRWFRLNRTLEIGHIVDAHRLLLLTLMDRVEKRHGKQLEERATYELPAQNR